MEGTVLHSDFNADSMQVGGHLLMRSSDDKQASFQSMTLNAVRVGGNVTFTGATSPEISRQTH